MDGPREWSSLNSYYPVPPTCETYMVVRTISPTSPVSSGSSRANVRHRCARRYSLFSAWASITMMPLGPWM